VAAERAARTSCRVAQARTLPLTATKSMAMWRAVLAALRR
jgi:hypothetical protein